MVVDARYYIVRINSAARQMLGIHGAAFDQDFVHLAEVLPPAAIRAAIDSALEGRTTSKVFEVEPTDAASETTRFVQVTVRPYRVESQSIAGAVIELTDATRLEHERVGGARTHERLEKAIATNGRLLRANEELTSLVSELRGANETMLLASEDAQATREEVETINEEFQATNEELETLNEELTASVEELRVANEDLATRTDELSAKTASLEQQRLSSEEEHDRLRSILASLGDAIVAVDHEGRIVMTNGSYDRLFGGVAAEFAPEDAAGLPIQPSELPQMGGSRREVPLGIRHQPARRGAALVRGRRRTAQGPGPDLGRSGRDPGHIRTNDAPEPREADGFRRPRTQDPGCCHARLRAADREAARTEQLT